MLSDKFNSRKTYEASDASLTPGGKIDGGPYIGIVKNNVDVTRSGRLEVYIPLMGGPDPENPQYWHTCHYASPFFGHTNTFNDGPTSSYDQVRQSYGFWMVPPDIGVRVLVVFVNGDKNLAYWFACVPDMYSHHMVPAIGSRTSDVMNVDLSSNEVKNAINSRNRSAPTAKFKYPAAEVDLRDGRPNGAKTETSYFHSKKRPIHDDVYKQLVSQGLDTDTVRGAVSSSSQRETPSNVFGFSTPGRPIKDIARLPNSESIIDSDADIIEYLMEGKQGRRGGHSLVLDDGDVVGRDILVRLRTARGHQILLNDSEDLIYIGSANGKTWIELSADGQVLIYANNSVSLRTQKDFNLHADGDINLNAGKSIKAFAGSSIGLESAQIRAKSTGQLNIHSSGQMTIKSDADLGIQSQSPIGMTSALKIQIEAPLIEQNSGLPRPQGVGLAALTKNKLPDTELQGPIYVSVPGKIQTVAAAAPTHEPYAGHAPPKDQAGRASVLKGTN